MLLKILRVSFFLGHSVCSYKLPYDATKDNDDKYFTFFLL